MRHFWKTIVRSVGFWLLRQYRASALELLRVRAALLYVRVVRGARGAFIAGLVGIGSLALAAAGFVLFHVGLFFVLPPPYNAWALMGLGATYVAVGLGTLMCACSERAWMRLSGANEVVRRAVRRRQDADQEWPGA